MTLIVGETIAWAITVTDSAGAAADPGTGPTATVTLPDATSASATVTKTATGAYTATLVSTLAGRYRCTWSASGANSSDFPFVQVADVSAADPRYIISIEDARAALNLATSDRTPDEEIRLYVQAATEIVEDLVGPVLTASVTEKHTGGGYALGLFRKATAITSVTEDGTALTSGDYSLDPNSGLLWRGTYPGAGTWSADTTAGITVVYTVGAAVVPPSVILAGRELVRHLYAVGQQPWRQPYGGGIEDAMLTTPSGYAVPNRVVQLLKPHMSGRVPGFA